MKNNKWEQTRSVVDRLNTFKNYGLEEDEVNVVTEYLLKDQYAQRLLERGDTDDIVNTVISSYRMGRERLSDFFLRI